MPFATAFVEGRMRAEHLPTVIEQACAEIWGFT